MASLYATMDRILEQYGHNIGLQRRVDNGYENKIEIHTVRHMFPATRGLPRTREEEIEGITTNVDMIYFFRHDAAPNEGDRIYDEVPAGQHVFIIDYALPMRGIKGEITFWEVGCTRDRPE